MLQKIKRCNLKKNSMIINFLLKLLNILEKNHILIERKLFN